MCDQGGLLLVSLDIRINLITKNAESRAPAPADGSKLCILRSSPREGVRSSALT